MKTIHVIGLSIVLSAAAWFLTSLTGTSHAQVQNAEVPAVVRWEYTESIRPDVREMNRLGAQGWELCGVVDDGIPNHRCIFKRPKR